MSNKRIAILPGDGIGPEIMAATLRVVEAVGFQGDWVYFDAGLAALEKALPPMPKETIEGVREIGVALKGPTTTPSGTGHVSANVALRKALDLFANVRPAKTIPGVAGPYSNKEIDLIIVRENTEGLYSGFEYQPHPDVAQAIKVITRPNCKRLFQYTFDMARRQGRKRVTLVHKANIMKLTDGMMLEEFYKEAANWSEFQVDDVIVDNCCMQLVTRPEKFDVLVTENLYGDIVSDLAAGLVGGLGLAPGANIGATCAVFEAVHGSAPDIAGQGIANPIALMLSAAMMLRHLGCADQADTMRDAILEACRQGGCLTRDLGGSASTDEFASHIVDLATTPSAV
ncbi:MAG: isocitrate/isopropylmalate dehydrogenase family protein [Fimbriimonadaceae bacterium]|nr:isocitrate/isopropylmalate dehydrogenase family protein [Fimbriimonadaceae bacterium]NUM39827.1 isocitrate/isopropylmalate dehydrogenase family protein [Armatimonadota bacterium]